MDDIRKIVNISEPSDSIEQQKVDGAREFEKSLTTTVCSAYAHILSAGGIGFFAANLFTSMNQYAAVGVLFCVVLNIAISHMQLVNMDKLRNLYNDKEQEELSEEKKR